MSFRFILIACLVLLFSGCRKELDTLPVCESLKQSMQADDTELMKSVITGLIMDLPSGEYSEYNIRQLVSAINSRCSVTASLLCYDCIKTLPSQTEIRINLPVSGLGKTIDITYDTQHRMVFGNMHD
jgi:hypothetical protein